MAKTMDALSGGRLHCLMAAPSYRLQLPLYTHKLKHFAALLGGQRSRYTELCP